MKHSRKCGDVTCRMDLENLTPAPCCAGCSRSRLRYTAISRCSEDLTRLRHGSLDMSRTSVASQTPKSAAAIGRALRQLTAYCYLLGRVMSWAFGLKAKTVNDDKKKSQDGSQTDVDRLQGYHELAKVNIARSASVRRVSVQQM